MAWIFSLRISANIVIWASLALVVFGLLGGATFSVIFSNKVAQTSTKVYYHELLSAELAEWVNPLRLM